MRIDDLVREQCALRLPDGAKLLAVEPEGLSLRVGFAHESGASVSLKLYPTGRAPAACARTVSFDVALLGDPAREGREADRDLIAGALDALTTITQPLSMKDWEETLGREADERFMGGPAIEMKLVSACNQRCVFCKSPDEPANLVSADDVGETLRRLAGRGKLLTFSGGETCLDPRLVQHVRAARLAGFERIEVQTNGMLLEDPVYARSLVDAGTTSLLVSLHSHFEQLSDEITRRRGGYRATLRGIDNALALPVDVSLCHVICNLNHRYLPDYARFVRDRFGGSAITLVFTYSVPTHRVRDDPSLMPRLSELGPTLAGALAICEPLRSRGEGDSKVSLFSKLAGVIEGSPTRLVRAGRALQRQARRFVNARPRAHVLASCGLPLCFMGGLEPFHDEYWQRSTCPAGEELVHPARCSGCTWIDRCSGIWRLYEATHGIDEIVPVVERPAARHDGALGRLRGG